MTVTSSSPAADARGPVPLGRGLIVAKGHGTENDFVIIEDLAGSVDLTAPMVRALCDRRAGIGADGVLRVVRTRVLDSSAGPDAPEFFMDYRNADGSQAEMCGNGARVFVRYLLARGLAGLAGLRIATRSGDVEVGGAGDGEPADWLSVTLGPACWLDPSPSVDAPGLTAPRIGVAVSMPNPHVVVFVDGEELAALDLSSPPSVDPPLPEGQNVEFVVRREHQLDMRVHERGVGETRSCGTGITAAVVAASASQVDVGAGVGAGTGADVGAGVGGGGGAGAGGCGRAGVGADSGGGRSLRPVVGDGRPWFVHVPGGTCAARWRADGHVVLSGPAVLVASVDLDPAWLAAAGG